MIKIPPRILLHVCCAPCSTHVVSLLQGSYDVTAFFFNPNIAPPVEYSLRATEVVAYLTQAGIPILEEQVSETDWLLFIAGHEDAPEGGSRCSLCYEYRLRRTASKASAEGYDFFGSTLTISPHKNASVINALGTKIAEESGIHFLEADFKKKDGYKISCDISKKHGLYRQNYCGCRFSK